MDITVNKKTVLCPECNERIKGGHIARHIKEAHAKENLTCGRCGKKFTRRQKLTSHRQNHCKSDPNLFPYRCACGESFKTEIKCKNHQKDSRYCVLKTICNKCKSKFSTVKELKNHCATCQDVGEDNVEQNNADPDGPAGENLEGESEAEGGSDAREGASTGNTPGNSDSPKSATACGDIFDDVILGNTDLADFDYEEVVRNVGNISFSF